MQARPDRDIPPRDLGPGGRVKGGFKPPEIAEALFRRRLGAEQCPESAPVNGADRAMPDDGKDQRRDVVAPMDLAAQAVARPRPKGSSRRTISQTATRPASQTALVIPMRVTITAVKAPSPPSAGIAASSVTS